MKPAARTPAWKKAVNRFRKSERPQIDSIWDNRGVLPAEAVARLGISPAEIGTLMMRLVPLAAQYAMVPVSRYEVGAVAAGMPERGTGWCSLYLGANFEFRNAALSFTTHAEQAAVNNAWLNGERGIQMLAVSAVPCGYCRQFLYELAAAKRLSILVPKKKGSLAFNSTPLPTFLPDAFGPRQLKVTGGLMDPKLCSHRLALNRCSRQDKVVDAAFEAASRSYAPYRTGKSFNYAGVALELASGAIYAGRYAENAAYNPSLSPLQSALTFLKLARPSAQLKIKRCVLVEVPTLGSQREATRAALAAYAPNATFQYCTARIV
jgi:cytidine deaminase